ncbi:MAG: MBL fold metallo-hydrolase [Sphingobacteriaceae bacterium]|nr:MBL fold metallo-hydrolase [Cytophagaceae bacterium]
MLYFLLVLVVLAAATWAFLQLPVFGANPSGARLARIEKSPNYRDGSFQYPLETPMMAPNTSYPAMIREFLFSKTPNREPDEPLPSVKTDLNSLRGEAPVVVWFGHSSYFIRIGGKNLLVDPVFSNRASPVQFAGTGSYPGTRIYSVADLPTLDAVILTHDHYDHLDYETIRQLIPKMAAFHTALGVGAHLERWGIPPEKITEYDWWESGPLATDLTLVATPARHFSGRGLTRGKTLWVGFVLRSATHTLYLGGDSGYGPHFREIGEKYGPFDLALLENGQYDEKWPFIHMMPEEVAQAALDLRAKTLLPVHWGKFTLALHSWTDPIERVTRKAHDLGLPITTPKIGEPVVVGGPYTDKSWWR